jgi:phosphoesterase RecJ-like protein
MKPLPPKTRDKLLLDILKAVKKGKTFLLSGHHKPDGDTVGSELAFAGFLRRLGKKKVDIINAESVPRQLMFLPGADRIKAQAKVDGFYDVVVVFECSGPDRMGNIIDLDTQAGLVINIDHHAHHSHFGDINLINPFASSNSEQLFHLFRLAKMKITKDEASALYVGLVTDTGRFQQENANPESHRVAAGLLEAGIDVADLSWKVFGIRPVGALKALSRGLASLTLEAGGRVAVMSVTPQDFAQTGAGPEDTEDIVNHGLLVPGVDAVVFVRPSEKPGEAKVSLRGRGAVDLCKVAVSFGGGGHKNASGCNLAGSVPEVARRLADAVSAALPK